MKWLFASYDGKAFGLFRFCFYMTMLLYYGFFQTIYPDSWLAPEFASYFEPISFFKFMKLEDFGFLTKFDIYRFWRWCMLFSAVGFIFPLTSILSFLGLLILAGVGLNFGKIHHVNHMPVVILGILSFSISAGGYSVDSLLAKLFKKKLPQPTTWAFKTAQIYMCILYFASGFQKLRNTGLDWIFSSNMETIIITRPTVTALGIWVASHPLLCKGLAFVTVMADLFAPLALFSKRARFIIIPTLFMFHVGTYSVLGLHGYFLPYNLCYLVWLPWERILSFKSDILYFGSRLFERHKWAGEIIKSFYVRMLFPVVRGILKFRYGKGFELILRHSILTKRFNPFLSDIDYTLVVNKDFKHLNSLLVDLLKLRSLKIFDYPQVYLEEEWKVLTGIPAQIQEKIQFVWNFRKVGWLNHIEINNRYERYKKEKAKVIAQQAVDRFPNWTLGDKFPSKDASLPEVSLYSNYLEMTNERRIYQCDVHQLMFLISHLPNELNWVELDKESMEFKRQLWISEYLLSRSHLRTHSREGKNVSHYRPFLRELEVKYKLLFLQSIVAEGEEFDLT